MENRYRKWYMTIDLINSMLTVFDILHRYILVLTQKYIPLSHFYKIFNVKKGPTVLDRNSRVIDLSGKIKLTNKCFH